nr:glycoside hydrolase family 31 protein [Candidatus Freyarchaeota archaeon]
MARKQWISVGSIQNYNLKENVLEIKCGELGVEITIISPGIIRVHLTTPDQITRESWAIINQELPIPKFEFSEEQEFLEISTKELVLRIGKNPCRLEFLSSDRWLINRDDAAKGMGWDGEQVRCWKEMPQGEHYFGFGEKAGPLGKRDQALTMWNTDNIGHYTPTDPLYESFPFFLGLREGRSYGIFLDNTYRSSFDMGKESADYYSFGASSEPLDYYFIYGPEPKQVISRYTELTGRMPLPPLWSIAYHQSRWSYYPESKVRQIADEFRKRRIPCDVLWLDIDYMDGYRCFTWDKNRFPDPKKLISEFRKQGFKMTVITDPGIKVDRQYHVYKQGISGNHFIRVPNGQLFSGVVWPGDCHFPDFANSKTREWWGTLYKELVDMEVAGFWVDMNEPSVQTATNTMSLDAVHDVDGRRTDHREIHNVYGLEMARAVHEGLRRLRPNIRPFVLTRSAFSGIQSYAAVWTGDNESSWEHLRLSIPMCLNIGVSGEPFVGADIGGFRRDPSPELYARWIQLGVFYPLCRTHTMIGTADQEPWSYGEEVENISRKYIELRYRLLPYIYNCFYQSSQTGVPVMRAMFIDFPDDPFVLSNSLEGNVAERQFMFGDWLLIAPVVYEDAKTRTIYLPKGEWFNFWTNEKHDGAFPTMVNVTLDVCPIFVRGGAIIPMRDVVQHSDEKTIDPLILSIYPSETSKVQYYEDDGVSFDYTRGEFLLVNYTCSKTENGITFEISKREGNYKPEPRSYEARFNGVKQKPSKVLWSGEIVKGVTSENELRSKTSGWIYLEDKQVVAVRIPDRGKPERIEIILGMSSS